MISFFQKNKKQVRKVAIHAIVFVASMALLFVAFGGSPAQVKADSSQLSNYLQLKNPIKGTTDVNGFLGNILDAVVIILTPVLVIMVIYSGFMFVSAKGNAEKLGDAKKALMYTLLGAAIVFGAHGLSDILGRTAKCLVGTNC